MRSLAQVYRHRYIAQKFIRLDILPKFISINFSLFRLATHAGMPIPAPEKRVSHQLVNCLRNTIGISNPGARQSEILVKYDFIANFDAI